MMLHRLVYIPLIMALASCGQPGLLYLPTKATPVLVKPKPELKEPKKDKS
jgi:predicted small lipoprotein YifL